MKTTVANPDTQRVIAPLSQEMVNELKSGIGESRATTVIAGGGPPLLRLLKDGNWVFGQGNEELQPQSSWVVRILTIEHGYCCWVDSELRGQAMAPINKPKPVRPPPIGDIPYTEQRSFELKCLDGIDAGTEVLYKSNSVGGMRAIDGLLAQIQKRLEDDPGYPCPVLQFDCDSYIHSKHGKIYTPILTVVGWADLNDNLSDALLPVAAAAPAGKPPAKPAVVAAEPPPVQDRPYQPQAAEPRSTAQMHAGQRRRPSR